MGYKIEKCFDYANFKIDFESKTVNVTYPYKTPLFAEFLLFSVVGLIPVALASIILTLLLGTLADGIDLGLAFFPIALMMTILYYWVCYKTDFVRDKVIRMSYNKAEENQIVVAGVTGRKIKITNAGNYFTEYKLTKDYKEYIKTFEIVCIDCLVDNKGLKRYFASPRYKWEIIVTFSKTPREGKMIIYNQRGENDETNGDIDVIIDADNS